jgi:hypothetical protein
MSLTCGYSFPSPGQPGRRLCAVRELRRRLALFDEAPSAFVVVVGVMGENADRHTLLRVPDGERSATVIDEAGIVETVSPGGVFERPITDDGPESRNLGPRGFRASGALPCHPARGQSLSPVLDSQVTSGCGIAC